MHILVDQDEVLARTDESFVRYWGGLYDKLKFDGFPRPKPLSERKNFMIMHDYPDEFHDYALEIFNSKGFFRNLEPYQEAVDAVKEMISFGLDISICTTPMPRSRFCVYEKSLWLVDYFGEDILRHTIFTADKTTVRGDYLFDDNPRVIGKMKPVWKQIVPARPYNEETPNVRINDLSHWRSAIQVLENDVRLKQGSTSDGVALSA